MWFPEKLKALGSRFVIAAHGLKVRMAELRKPLLRFAELPFHHPSDSLILCEEIDGIDHGQYTHRHLVGRNTLSVLWKHHPTPQEQAVDLLLKNDRRDLPCQVSTAVPDEVSRHARHFKVRSSC